MRTVWLGLAFSGILAAQPPLVRGTLLERDTRNPAGEFSVRAADNQVFRYQFDRKTYVERDQDLIDVSRLHPGEKVEVVSDSLPGSVLRYARTIHVISDAPKPRPTLTASRLRTYRSIPLFRTGNLTYSGSILRVTKDRIVLHTRTGEQSLALRNDTQYLQNGEIVEADVLKPNMRVFIRAGKDLYDQVEAYQVIWGKILDPK